MPDSPPSRRSVLKTGATLGGLASIGGLAGCMGILDSQSTSGKLDSVPSGSTTVLYADVARFLSDDSVEGSLDEQLSTYSEEMSSVPASLSDALDRIEDETGLDPRQLNELITFGEVGADDSFGAVVWTDWSESDLVDAAEWNDTEATETTYEGKTLYDGGEDDWIGVLDDGVFALGTENSVKSVVDTHSGDADAVGGDVRSAYEQTRDGYVRFAFEVPDEAVPEDSSGQFDVSVFSSVQTGHGSISAGSDSVFSLSLQTADGESAENVADVIDGGLVTLRNRIEESSPMGPSGEQLSDSVISTIDATEVSQDGSTVTVTISSDIGDFVAVFGAIVGSFVLGLGSSPQARAPQAAFSFDYDADAGVVEITHDAGDTIRASQLSISGSGFANASGADMTGPGTWQGTTSASMGGQPAIAAGDRVTVGFQSDGELRVVWEGDQQAATLAMFRGPDA
jgi:hypothetical protein